MTTKAPLLEANIAVPLQATKDASPVRPSGLRAGSFPKERPRLPVQSHRSRSPLLPPAIPRSESAVPGQSPAPVKKPVQPSGRAAISPTPYRSWCPQGFTLTVPSDVIYRHVQTHSHARLRLNRRLRAGSFPKERPRLPPQLTKPGTLRTDETKDFHRKARGIT